MLKCVTNETEDKRRASAMVLNALTHKAKLKPFI